MAKITLHSAAIKCEGCVQKVKEHLESQVGVFAVVGDPNLKTVDVEYDGTQLDEVFLLNEMQSIEFPATLPE